MSAPSPANPAAAADIAQWWKDQGNTDYQAVKADLDRMAADVKSGAPLADDGQALVTDAQIAMDGINLPISTTDWMQWQPGHQFYVDYTTAMTWYKSAGGAAVGSAYTHDLGPSKDSMAQADQYIRTAVGELNAILGSA
jgi:hypothetical protein